MSVIFAFFPDGTDDVPFLDSRYFQTTMGLQLACMKFRTLIFLTLIILVGNTLALNLDSRWSNHVLNTTSAGKSDTFSITVASLSVVQWTLSLLTRSIP